MFGFLKAKNKDNDCAWIAAARVAAKNNNIPVELFVALILNESSGNPFATRWERRFFVRYIADRPLETLVPYHPKLDPHEEQLLRLSLAYSWGLCQIMGIVAVEHGFRGRQMWELLDIETNVTLGARLFAAYRQGVIRQTPQAKPEEVTKRTLLRYNGGADLDYPNRVFKRLAAAQELLSRCRG